MSAEDPPRLTGLATLLALATALRAVFAARLRLARKQAADRLHLAIMAVMFGTLAIILLGIGAVFILQSVAIALQVWLGPAMALVATAVGAGLLALVFILIARVCLRRAIYGPDS